jgi:2-keto-4-pentenoate hydratase
VQKQFGISDPCYGNIYADMVLIDGAEITKPVVSDLRVETEIAVVLKKDLTQTDTPSSTSSTPLITSFRRLKSATAASPAGT